MADIQSDDSHPRRSLLVAILFVFMAVLSCRSTWKAPSGSADLVLRNGAVIVLDRNLFDVRTSEIHDVKVQLTLLEGTAVWSDGALAPATAKRP